VAIAFFPRIRELLQQGTRENEPWAAVRARAIRLATEATTALAAPGKR
jgi:hypothetical protein